MLENLAYLHYSQAYENQEQGSEIALKPSKGWIALPLALFACLTNSQTVGAASVLSKGSYGNDVVRLQNQLKQANCFPRNTSSSGYYGNVTEAAVKKLQQKNNLVADGVAGSQTFNALANNKTCIAPSTRRELKLGSQGESVRLLQVQLNNWGFPVKGPKLIPDGKFGYATQAALKEFEAHVGLASDGIFDARASEILWQPKSKDSGSKDVQALIQQLKSDAQSERAAAAEALSQLGPVAEKALPQLIRLLNSPQESDQTAALNALEAIWPNPQDTVPQLIQLLKSEDKNERIAAAIALGSGPNPTDAVPQLTQLLKSEDENEQIAAAGALSSARSYARDAVPQLVLLLNDESESVSDSAINALTAIGADAKEAVPSLKALLKDVDLNKSLGVSFALLHIDPSVLVDLLDSGDNQSRLHAAYTVGFMKSMAQDVNEAVVEEVVTKLLALVKDETENIELRKRAAISSMLLKHPINQDVQAFYNKNIDPKKPYNPWAQFIRGNNSDIDMQSLQELYCNSIYGDSSGCYSTEGGGGGRGWFRRVTQGWRR